MKDKIFYLSCFGFALGVLLRSFLHFHLYPSIWVAFVSICIILFYKFIAKSNWGLLVGIFILAISLGIIRFHLADVPAPVFFESQVGQRVNLTGNIIDEPDVRETNQKLTVGVGDNNAKTKILLSADLFTDYKYGDEIKFFGLLEKPTNFDTDQGKNFDYINYLRKDGIFYVMKYPTVEVLSSGHGNFIKSALFSAKEKFLAKMNHAIPEPENLLEGGLILGEKSSFSQALRQSFVNTGTIHIVALSGYNVTIVAEWIMKLFSAFPKNLGIGMGIFAILLFVIMTGGSSTAIRAGIMATLALIARATSRNYDLARALMLAGIIMILINPFVLAYDVSFQLSFLATIAVIFLAPKIEKYFTWVTKKFQLRDIVSVTCAAYIFVFPFILYKMGNLSLVALPANVLILPFIPFTMLLGFLTGFAGLLWAPLSIPFGYLSYFFLHYELLIINFFSHLPFASIIFPNFPLLLTLAIYGVFIWKLFRHDIKKLFAIE